MLIRYTLLIDIIDGQTEYGHEEAMQKIVEFIQDQIPGVSQIEERKSEEIE